MTETTIQANHNPLFDIKELTFNFRKQKDETTGVETKRASVSVKVPVLSIEGIVDVLQRGEPKEMELLQSAITAVYDDYIKSVLADDVSLTTENFPSVDWATIANQPESERKGRGIPKEVWEDFIKDYLEIMPGLMGKPLETIKRQAAMLAAKLSPLKNHEKKEEALNGFKRILTLYVNSAPNAEQYLGCVEFLLKKCDSMLNSEKESNLVANLGFE